MRIATYNPLWASHERHEDISEALREWDIILLAGTKQKGLANETVTQGRMGRHWGLKSGWRAAFGRKVGRLVNNSCGVSIMVSNRMPQSSLRDVYLPPTPLRGRVLGARVQGPDYDFAIFCVYMANTHDRKHEQTANEIVAWIDSIIDRLGVRTTIAVGGDINSDFGLARAADGVVERVRSTAIGNSYPTLENANGRIFREFCERNELYICTTDHDVGATFFGPNGGRSRIDHVAVPLHASDMVRMCRTLPRAAKKLQVIRARGHRDHLPVGIDLHVTTLQCQRPPHLRREKLDRDALMRCLQKGVKRTQFLQTLDDELKMIENSTWQEALEQKTRTSTGTTLAHVLERLYSKLSLHGVERVKNCTTKYESIEWYSWRNDVRYGNRWWMLQQIHSCYRSWMI